MKYVSHIESSTGRSVAVDKPCTALPGEMLEVRYDLERIKREVSPRDIAAGPANLWRYAPLLPVADPRAAVSLGEGYTPLLDTSRLARALGLQNLAIKDEGRNPSGTFKDRGASVAISRYVELGVKTVAHNSSGNAGGSWSLYAARAGITCVNLLPTDVQPSSLQHCRASGQPAFLVENWHEAGRMVAEACERNGWLNICTLREPYRLEGKKTMAFELAEQLHWRWPDWIVYPTGGGTGLIGMWKGFEELETIGWVPRGRRPRMVSVQAEGCAPIVRAFEQGADHADLFPNAHTFADGLRVPKAVGDFLMLRAIRESGGTAIAVSDDSMVDGMRRLGRLEGISAAPEGGAALSALDALVAAGQIGQDDVVVLFNTGGALKYLDVLQ